MFKNSMLYKTPHIKPADMKPNYFIVDASTQTIGRLCAKIVNFVKGKTKTYYMPNALCGDVIIIINSEKVKMSGTKLKEHSYYWHTGYMGGIKRTTPAQLLRSGKSERVIFNTIKNMIPSGPMGRMITRKLIKIFPTEEHPYSSHSPKPLDIGRNYKIQRFNENSQ